MPVGSTRRALAGAVLLDFAVGPLFIWDTFSESLATELDASGPALSVAFSVGLALFTTGVLAGGRVADTVAPRRLAAVAGVGVVAGLGVSAIASSLPMLVVGFGVLLGGASGLGYATAVRVAGTVATGRGTAVALVVSAYAAGAVVLAPVANYLLDILGRAGTFAVLAALVGVLLAGGCVLLPGSAPPARERRSATAAPPPYRAPIPALWAMFSLGSAPALIAFAHAGEFAGGVELTVAAVSLLNAGNLIGRLVAGPAADRFGRAPALHTTAAALAGCCVALFVAQHTAITLTALLVLGTQYGALSVLTPVATADSVPAANFGSAYGIVFSGWGVVGLTGPVAAAWLASYVGFQAVAGVLAVVAVLAWASIGSTVTTMRRMAAGDA